jgi:hypothetical protein
MATVVTGGEIKGEFSAVDAVHLLCVQIGHGLFVQNQLSVKFFGLHDYLLSKNAPALQALPITGKAGGGANCLSFGDSCPTMQLLHLFVVQVGHGSLVQNQFFVKFSGCHGISPFFI